MRHRPNLRGEDKIEVYRYDDGMRIVSIQYYGGTCTLGPHINYDNSIKIVLVKPSKIVVSAHSPCNALVSD